MAEYYAVERTSEYLEHYGIKGMRWGVRKAIEKGNSKRLARHFIKANKKLDKLNKKADIDAQRKKARNHAIKAGLAAGIGGLGLASFNVQNKNFSDITKSLNGGMTTQEKLNTYKRKKKIVSSGNGVEIYGHGLHYHNYGQPHVGQTLVANIETGDIYHPALLGQIANMSSARQAKEASQILANKIKSSSELRRKTKKIALGTAALGFGTAAYQTGKYAVAKYRTTKKGHAKAVAKRDAWKKEMKSAFRKTKYGKYV